MYQDMYYLSIPMRGMDRRACDLGDNNKCIYQLTLWSSQLEKDVWELLANAFYFHWLSFPGLWNYDSRVSAVYEDVIYCSWCFFMYPNAMEHPRNHWGSNTLCIFFPGNLFYWPVDSSAVLSPLLTPQVICILCLHIVYIAELEKQNHTVSPCRD